MSDQHCPFCSGPVEWHSGDEGTQSVVSTASAELAALRARAEKAETYTMLLEFTAQGVIDAVQKAYRSPGEIPAVLHTHLVSLVDALTSKRHKCFTDELRKLVKESAPENDPYEGTGPWRAEYHMYYSDGHHAMHVVDNKGKVIASVRRRPGMMTQYIAEGFACMPAMVATLEWIAEHGEGESQRRALLALKRF